MNRYDSKKHHRRSIRLKGHDYAGGGLYFVTICAARGTGNIFSNEYAKKIISHIWEEIAVGAGFMSAQEGRHKAYPYVVMPDHFHGLFKINAGEKLLGDYICEFKSRVVHEYIDGVKKGCLPAFDEKIWHRNYYEMIVHDDDEEKNISNYIKMNPWKCVMDFGNGLKGMGNPALWEMDKLGVLCSRGAPSPDSIPNAEVYMGGFHSPMEEKILARLLELKKRIIYCPAWGLNSNLSATMIDALEENRMLILEMQNKDGDLFAAEERNRFIIENADELWVPYVSPGGMLSRLM